MTIAVLICCYGTQVRTVLIGVVLIGVVLLASACGGERSERTVATGFYPLAFAVERVAGDEVAVRNLTPPGVEPHELELTPKDVGTIAEADLVIYLGGGFQPALERAVASTRAEALDVLKGLTLLEPEGAQDDRTEAVEEDEARGAPARDPHVWLDPIRYAAIARRIGDELDRPAAGDRLARELAALDAEFRSGLRRCTRRQLVTSHAAFGYLADRYGLEQVAITGLSPEAEPTPGELRDVVQEVRAQRATTVFFETLVSPRLAETVAREVGAQTAVLNPLEGLTGAQAADGEDYFSVMRDNLAVLRRALGCR